MSVGHNHGLLGCGSVVLHFRPVGSLVFSTHRDYWMLCHFALLLTWLLMLNALLSPRLTHLLCTSLTLVALSDCVQLPRSWLTLLRCTSIPVVAQHMYTSTFVAHSWHTHFVVIGSLHSPAFLGQWLVRLSSTSTGVTHSKELHILCNGSLGYDAHLKDWFTSSTWYFRWWGSM